MATDWQCIPREYEIKKNHLQRRQTNDHPLKQQTITVVDSKVTSTSLHSNNNGKTRSNIALFSDPLGLSDLSLDGQDPLSQFARQEEELMDPLSKMATEYKNNKKITKEPLEEEAINWNSKRLGILNRFTTSEKLSISTSFLTTGTVGACGGDTIKAQTVVADKVKYRLEQLDDFEDGSMRHMMDLTQQEYIQRIEQLNQELVQSWNSDQRVKALKICIQCAKMLADTSVLQFYPSQFVLLTDILDIFGKLVYERLHAKAYGDRGDADAGKKQTSEADFERATETCLNWFYKIASIRELLPRLYVEIAIIKCCEFLQQNNIDQVLYRISQMIRGIGDPLVSVYIRCYLVRVGLTASKKKDFILENFNDFLFIYHTIFSGSIRSELNRQRIDMAAYLTLYAPALDFIMQALMHNDIMYMKETLRKCEGIKNNGPLLLAILNSFKSEFIASNAVEMVKILANSNTDGISKGQLFRTLGNKISQCAALSELRLPLLNSAFHTINTFTDPGEYISCVETWAQFVAENFTEVEVNQFLGDIIKRLNQGKAYDKFFLQLQSVLYKIIQNYKQIDQLLIQDNFLPYLDLFHKESVKVEVCKNILTIFKRDSHQYTSDSVVTNALMYIGKILNDSVTYMRILANNGRLVGSQLALTVEDERRQISNLISSFIRKIDFEKDFERQLSFYVEARGTFTNLDAVYTTLVYAVNKLAMDTSAIYKTQKSKSIPFIKACVAFCFITIPSIVSVQTQMDLYLFTGQVALWNVCLGQADACFEAALSLVAELPRSIEVDGKLRSLETFLVSYLCNMLATLVVVPDSPEQGVLYLFRLLLDMVNKFPFELHSPGPTTVYLHALDMLYTQSLETFPYHIPEVMSNDELYGQDPKFLAEINRMCILVIDQILTQLKSLGAAQQFALQGTLALQLFTRIVRYADISKEKTFQLAVNLWMLALKLEKYIDSKLIHRTLEWLEHTCKLDKTFETQRAKGLIQLLAHLRRE